MEGCTFTPEVLPSSQAMIDDMFEKDSAENAMRRLSKHQTSSSKAHSLRKALKDERAPESSSKSSSKESSSKKMKRDSKLKLGAKKKEIKKVGAKSTNIVKTNSVGSSGGGSDGSSSSGSSSGTTSSSKSSRKQHQNKVMTDAKPAVESQAEPSQGSLYSSEIFKLLDSNHNGQIEKKVFRKDIHDFDKSPPVMKMYELAGFTARPTKEQLKALFREIDAIDGDDSMTEGSQHFLNLLELTKWFELKLGESKVSGGVGSGGGGGGGSSQKKSKPIMKKTLLGV
jgi:hypothetical protein